MGKYDISESEQRLRNKIRAAENQAKAFRERLEAFRNATLWQRLLMALKGEV